ncbi:VIT1/CCC1 transporter family protein [Adhaeretor mobilis]|uniref:VIT family protein n=1 Tax=Adhaeretor mobilis TaxID=1930276 RepID=A0A517MQL3_9BACT|nr:VIT1/CCC1 transporter family protein [Adhaeretor mobilis]QDS97175.1 VIT family protein [Adhaeretor mobilis]
MNGSHSHAEQHRSDQIGWLRAANDGMVSVSSLIIGVAANTERSTILLWVIAGLVPGAMSMAAGEYVSVSSQADAEEADRKQELDKKRGAFYFSVACRSHHQKSGQESLLNFATLKNLTAGQASSGT